MTISVDTNITPDLHAPPGTTTKEVAKSSWLEVATRAVHNDVLAGILPYSDYDMRLFTCRPSTRKPLSTSRYEEVRRMRSACNHENKFVKVVAAYECMNTLASQLDMRSLKAVAHTCKELHDGFNLEDADSYENWASRVTMIRMWERPFIAETASSRKRSRDDENDEEYHQDEEQPDPKRIMSTHWRVMTFN